MSLVKKKLILRFVQNDILKSSFCDLSKMTKNVVCDYLVYCLLFTILRPFGTRESIRWKVDHGGQIVLWYWQHATNLARATVFVVCMSSTKVLVWVRGRVKQKHSLTFCVFGQIRSKCSSSSTFPKSQLRQNLSVYGTPFHTPSTASSCVLPHRNRARTFRNWTHLMSQKYLSLSYDIPLKRKYLVCTLVPISRLVKSFLTKANRILSFTLFTFNIVWGKPGGGGIPTSWLIGPLVIDLPPTGYISFARQVRCMCVEPGTVPNSSSVVPAWSTWVVVNWSVVSNGDWAGGKKPATSWGWLWSSHFFMDPTQHFFPATSIASWASHAFPKMRSLVTMLTRL